MRSRIVIIFFNFIPVGRATEIEKKELSAEEREEFMKILYHEMVNRRIEVLSTAPQYARICLLVDGGPVSPTHFYAGGAFAARTLAEFVGGSGAGRIYAGIEPDGTVVPCVFMPISVGNVRESSFRNIWEESEEMKLLGTGTISRANAGIALIGIFVVAAGQGPTITTQAFLRTIRAASGTIP